jgi:hypothetical protein
MTGAIRDIEVESGPLTVRGYALALTLATVSGAGAFARALRAHRAQSHSPLDPVLLGERPESVEHGTTAN